MLCNLLNGLWLFNFYWLFLRTNDLWRAPCHSTLSSPSGKYHECSKSLSVSSLFSVYCLSFVPYPLPLICPFFVDISPSPLFTFALSFQLFLSKTFPDIFKSGKVVGFYRIDQTLTDVLCVFIGWLCRQCFGLQTVLASLSGWYEGQQAWHEPAPFCGTSK